MSSTAPSTAPRGYVVVDVETTGLSPRLGDRLVELAIVHLDPGGRVTGRWETLLNPERDLDPGAVHGIRESDVARAPRFADIAPRLVELLDGRLLVAHGAAFDAGFLAAELERAGVGMPEGWSRTTLCTMRLARDFLPGAGRSLRDCCAAYDIDLADTPRASAEALAAAHLFAAYLGASPYPETWSRLLESAPVFPPAAAGSASAGSDDVWMPRPSTAIAEPTSTDFLARISERLPEYAGPGEHLDYLALLDRALREHRLGTTDAASPTPIAETLTALAETSKIGRRGAATLHRRFFDDLVGAAWAEGVLTHHELAALTRVAEQLSIPAAAVAEATDPRGWATRRVPAAHIGDDDGVRRAESDVPRRPRHRLGGDGDELLRLDLGDGIALTGQMSRPRVELERELRSLGFQVCTGVSRATRLLVASDPGSESGKARKARDYGVTIVAEEALERMLQRVVRDTSARDRYRRSARAVA